MNARFMAVSTIEDRITVPAILKKNWIMFTSLVTRDIRSPVWLRSKKLIDLALRWVYRSLRMS